MRKEEEILKVKIMVKVSLFKKTKTTLFSDFFRIAKMVLKVLKFNFLVKWTFSSSTNMNAMTQIID